MDKAVQDYITDSLRLCGQMEAPGRGPAPEQTDELTRFFNQMLDGWNSMRNRLYSINILTLSLSPFIQWYLIGTGAVPTTIGGVQYGAFNVQRPQKITAANLIYQTQPEQLKVPIKLLDEQGWADVRVPGIFSIPLYLYCDYGYSQSTPTGLAQMVLWPGPQIGYQLELFVWNELTSVLGYDDTLYAPEGYARALTYNFALEILPLYRKGMNQGAVEMITRVANESRNALESKNAPCPEAVLEMPDSGRIRGRSRFNWLAPLG